MKCERASGRETSTTTATAAKKDLCSHRREAEASFRFFLTFWLVFSRPRDDYQEPTRFLFLGRSGAKCEPLRRKSGDSPSSSIRKSVGPKESKPTASEQQQKLQLLLTCSCARAARLGRGLNELGCVRPRTQLVRLQAAAAAANWSPQLLNLGNFLGGGSLTCVHFNSRSNFTKRLRQPPLPINSAQLVASRCCCCCASCGAIESFASRISIGERENQFRVVVVVVVVLSGCSASAISALISQLFCNFNSQDLMSWLLARRRSQLICARFPSPRAQFQHCSSATGPRPAQLLRTLDHCGHLLTRFLFCFPFSLARSLLFKTHNSSATL